MTIQKRFRISIIIACLLTIGACQPDKKPKKHVHDHQSWRHVHIKGDVDSFIEGTKLNSESIFDEKQLEFFNGFSLAGVNIFSEQITYSSSEDSDSVNNSDTTEYLFTTKNYRFERLDDNTIAYVSPEDDFFATVEFKREGTKFVPTRMFTKYEDLHFNKVLHYSLKNDGNSFSILAEFSDEKSGKSLIAIYFNRNLDSSSKTQEFVRSNFSYLLGYYRGVPWRNPVNFEICGSRAIEHEDVIRDAIKAWDIEWPSGHIGGLGYTISANPNPPPFSDLNHTCIYFINTYDFGYHDESDVLGLTTWFLDLNRLEIVQSSVFIPITAHKKTTIPIRTVIMHEIGHMLGLGHEFTKDDTGETKYPSVMGYDGVDYVTERDRDAIRALYPLKSNDGSPYIDLADRVFVQTTGLSTDEVEIKHFLVSDRGEFPRSVRDAAITIKNNSNRILCLFIDELIVVNSLGGNVKSKYFIEVEGFVIMYDSKHETYRSHCILPSENAYAHTYFTAEDNLTVFDFDNITLHLMNSRHISTDKLIIFEELLVEMQQKNYIDRDTDFQYEIELFIKNESNSIWIDANANFFGFDKHGRFIAPIATLWLDEGYNYIRLPTQGLHLNYKVYFRDRVKIVSRIKLIII